MTQPITLTAQQAAELHTTGRLTDYREKCEVKVPQDVEILDRKKPDGSTFWYYEEFNGEDYDEWGIVPPRDTDTAYAVKEPSVQCDCESTGEPIYCFGEEVLGKEDVGIVPDGYERQHARITDIKLIIEDGELWWDMDLEKVAKNGK